MPDTTSISDLSVTDAACVLASHAARSRSQMLRAQASVLRSEMQDVFAEIKLNMEACAKTGSHPGIVVPTPSAIEHVAEPAIASVEPVEAFMAATSLSEDDLGSVADDLIAAYTDALDADEEQAKLFAGALHQIGCYLAKQLGPKAAGLTLN